MNKILYLIIVAFFLALFNLVFVVKTFSQDLPAWRERHYGYMNDTFYVLAPQDSIKVKILKVKGNSVEMKTMKRPRVKLFTFCKCPYKKNQIVWIKKP